MINYDYSNIPQDWLVANLGKVAVFEDGKRIPLKEEDRSKIRGKYPYYGASGIIDYVNDYLFDQERILFAEDGANILMRSTPVAFKATGKYWVNNHAHVLKPNDNTNIDYLTTYLESLSYIKFNTGSTQPKLNRAICNKIPVLLPPLPEQKAIADLLSSWDEAIEKTQRLIQVKEKRFYALLSKLISDNGQLTTSDSSADETDYCRWKKVKLGDVCKVITSNVDKKTSQNEVPVRLCNYMDVYKNFYITSELNFMEVSATASEIKKFHLKKNDVLLTKDSETPDDIANSACVLEEMNGVLCGSHLAILRPKSSIKGKYLNYALHIPRIRYDFSRHANGVTRFGLTMQAYDKVQIPLPPLEEQKQIAETLSTAQQEIDLFKQLAEKYKTQKRGLMQKLLTGDWRIKPEILNKYKEA